MRYLKFKDGKIIDLCTIAAIDSVSKMDLYSKYIYYYDIYLIGGQTLRVKFWEYKVDIEEYNNGKREVIDGYDLELDLDPNYVKKLWIENLKSEEKRNVSMLSHIIEDLKRLDDLIKRMM